MNIENKQEDQKTELQQPITRYSAGEKVNYPGQGVAEIIIIETHNIGGSQTTVYLMKLIAGDRKILVPVDNVDVIGIRPLINESQIRQVMDTLRAGIQSQKEEHWLKRHREYRTKIKSGSATDLAEVYVDLRMQSKTGRLKFAEVKMMDYAKSLLVTEIAAARKCTEIQAWTEIQSIFATRP